MPKPIDDFTLELFSIPKPQPCPIGDHSFAGEAAAVLSQVLAESTLSDRYAISAELSRKAGKEVSKHMLDGYASPARLDHALPFWLAPIVEEVCHSHLLTDWLVAKRGGVAAYGKDALKQELGKLVLLREQTLKELDKRIKGIESILGDE